MNYILKKNGEIVEEPDVLKFSRWFGEMNNRRIDRTVFDNGAYVSTVFLGIDHNYDPDSNTPILFETMIFGGEFSEECTRTSTVEEAKQCHKDAVKLLTEINKYTQVNKNLLNK